MGSFLTSFCTKPVQKNPLLYFPKEITNIIINYAPKEMLNYLKSSDYDWKGLYYELYKETTVRPFDPFILQRHDNKYLNEILNRMNGVKYTLDPERINIKKLLKILPKGLECLTPNNFS